MDVVDVAAISKGGCEMKDNSVEIESIMVEVDGELFDIVSFSDPKAAEADKRAIRRWAEKAAVKANLWSQKASVLNKPHRGLESRLNPAQ
jgi:hypothetical protein